MKGDWDVIKGRFGFNNAETETSRFSLRTELFRISPDASGESTWAQVLEDHVVEDLNQVPEFRRYCRPYTDSTDPQPGIVIEFPSYVMAGKNFFGMDLAGGDNAYDASHASTKIRSMGAEGDATAIPPIPANLPNTQRLVAHRPGLGRTSTRAWVTWSLPPGNGPLVASRRTLCPNTAGNATSALPATASARRTVSP